ncbi:MAG: ABC transporter ATP-binding protein [Alkalilacustris sp.]
MAERLDISDLQKAFAGEPVLRDIALSVAQGAFVSLVGASGCGKSTLLRLIAGLDRQDAGEIRIGAHEVSDRAPRDRDVAMVFQSYALYPHMTVHENIATPLVMQRLRLADRLPLLGRMSPRRRRAMPGIDAEVVRIARQLQIEALLGRKPAQLSGGQRQRVALARAMVRHPAVFLMDEPLSNLDAKLRVHMRGELTALHRRLEGTFLYVTHDQVEAMTMSDRVALMSRGRILQFASPDEIYGRPASLEVAQFIGSPAINCFDITDQGGRLVSAGLPLPARAAGARPATLAVRPEDLRPLPPEAPSDQVGWPARIDRVEHHGAERIVAARITCGSGPEVLLRVSAAEAVRHALVPGATSTLHTSIATCHFFCAEGKRVEVDSPGAHRPAQRPGPQPRAVGG